MRALHLGSRRRRIAAVLLLLGGAVVLNAWRLRDTPSSDVWIEKPLYSADGKYTAVVFTDAGGAGPSSYCFNEVSVVPASVAPAQAYAHRFRVYEGSCHTLGLIQQAHDRPIMADGPLLKWSGPRTLDITFDPRQASLDGGSFLFVDHDAGQQVHIAQQRFHARSTAAAGPVVHYRMPDFLD